MKGLKDIWVQWGNRQNLYFVVVRDNDGITEIMDSYETAGMATWAIENYLDHSQFYFRRDLSATCN